MSESREITRREFTVLSALAVLGGATITVTGCGGSGNPASASMGDGSVSGTISANHGHAATISSAELQTAGALSLNIQYQADHNHVVALTAADVVAVRGGTTVAKESTETQAHHHTVTFAGGNRNSGPGY